METLVINIPDKKIALVKQLLVELGVTINEKESKKVSKKEKTPNDLTQQTINDARNKIGLEKPIQNINSFINSI